MSKIHDLWEKYWIWPVVLGVVLTLITVNTPFRNALFTTDTMRTWLVLLSASGVLVGAQRSIYSPGKTDNDSTNVRYTILFSSVMFIVLGFAALIIACASWESPVLMAGGTLVIGGFFGLLFGYPNGVAQQTTTPANAGVMIATDPAIANQNVARAPSIAQPQDKNLLAEASSTLGKVLTGFTLAKYDTLTGFVSRLCHTIGPAFGPNNTTNFLLAGSSLTYFLAIGFVSGLLLPSYFMSGKFAQ